MTNTARTVLEEKLAAIEHQRWADWQQYMLDCAIKSGDDTIGIRTCGWPTQQFEAWQKLIDMGYEDLTEEQKQHDRDEVMRYLPVILAKLEQDMLELIGEDETDPSPVATGRTHNKAIRNELRAAHRSAIKDYFRQG